jgi:hypothetical protein
MPRKAYQKEPYDVSIHVSPLPSIDHEEHYQFSYGCVDIVEHIYGLMASGWRRNSPEHIYKLCYPEETLGRKARANAIERADSDFNPSWAQAQLEHYGLKVDYNAVWILPWELAGIVRRGEIKEVPEWILEVKRKCGMNMLRRILKR